MKEKRHIDALTYTGNDDLRKFKVKPLKFNDPERYIEFKKGETKYSELDIRPDTLSYLKRDYKNSFSFHQQEFDSNVIFAIYLEKLIIKYHINETSAKKIIAKIYSELDKKINTITDHNKKQTKNENIKNKNDNKSGKKINE